MKKAHRKLRLNRETLSNLSMHELGEVAGGRTTACTDSSGTSSSCTNDTCFVCTNIVCRTSNDC